MKILLVADLGGWSIHNRCKAIKKFLPQHEIDIFCERDKDKWLDENADKYDIIHFNFSFGLYRLADFIKRHADKCIITHSNERTILEGEGGDKKVLLDLMKTIKTTSVSKSISEKYPEVIYIPNGIDEDIFNKSKKLVVGYAGSQNTVKNFNLIEKACKELGVELKTTGQTLRTDKVHCDIKFEDMQDFYMGIDVYVHASSTEGCSNTTLEALSCNVPVITTKVGIWQELQDYVTFVEPNIESIKDALKKFMGRKLIMNKFLWKNIVPEYNKIYENIINKK